MCATARSRSTSASSLGNAVRDQHVDAAEASLVQSLKEKSRAIEAAANAAAEEDAARAAKVVTTARRGVQPPRLKTQTKRI